MTLGVRNPGQHTPNHSTIQMTEQQFREWLRAADSNGDGLVSWHELKQALHGLGINWATLKSWWAVFRNDLNHNHCIDGELEIKKLKEHAAKHWDIVVKA